MTQAHNYGESFRLDGKVALVTGGARGLGAEIANAFSEAGASVLLTDVLDQDGEKTAQALRQLGRNAKFLRHDVCSEADWERAVTAAIDAYGRIDVIVNNAGIDLMTRTAEHDVDAFRKVMDVNVTGTLIGIKHGLRAMTPGGRSGHGGSIINISSTAGIIGIPFMAAYCASKGAVRMMTKSTAVECARLKNGVRVNSIHPGFVHTPLADQVAGKFVGAGVVPDVETFIAATEAAHPLGFGEPRDIAGAALYLATDASRWVTGLELIVDGGLTAM